MARPPDPDRRARALADATDYVLRNGLAGLSLRPMAAALGTSTRMLLYDFGSKEKLVTAILAEARHRRAAMYKEHLSTVARPNRETVRLAWKWLTAEEQLPQVRLMFEVYTDAMTRPEAYEGAATAIVTDWLGVFGTAYTGDENDDLDVTLILATLRGLLLDRLTATDPSRVDRAFERFTTLLRD